MASAMLWVMVVDTRRELGSLRDTIVYLTVLYTQHISLNIDLERILRLP